MATPVTDLSALPFLVCVRARTSVCNENMIVLFLSHLTKSFSYAQRVWGRDMSAYMHTTRFHLNFVLI